jgi:hypothetical protein
MASETPSKPVSPLLVVLAWAVVGAPWLWGIVQTVKNAAKLFE